MQTMVILRCAEHLQVMWWGSSPVLQFITENKSVYATVTELRNNASIGVYVMLNVIRLIHNFNISDIDIDTDL